MNINANDLLVLHLNVNRTVGDETTHYSYFAENNVDVKQTLNKLVKNDLLKISNNLEMSLPKLTVPLLKDILRKNNLMVSGKKQELINRIINNSDKIDKAKLDLPLVYISTEKGQKIINETEYILHFQKSYLVSLPRAHKVAVNNINADDKIEAIYMNEIKYEKDVNYDRPRLNRLFVSLANYYRKSKQKKESARTFYNLAYYIQIEENLFYLAETRFDDEEIKNNLTNMYLEPDYLITDFYEQLIYVDELSEGLLERLFIKDIENYYVVDEVLAKSIIQYLISFVKKRPNDESYRLIIEYADKLHGNRAENYESNYYDDTKHSSSSENIKDKTQKEISKTATKSGSGCLLFLAIIGGITAKFFM